LLQKAAASYFEDSREEKGQQRPSNGHVRGTRMRGEEKGGEGDVKTTSAAI